MIVNQYSVMMLFMTGLGLALVGVLMATALWAARRIRAIRGRQQSSEADESVHLATLVAIVSLVLLVIGWPLLYTTLASFVPEVPGAMCIYGVTRVLPITTAVIQTAKPAVIFILGAWLLLEYVRRQSGRVPRQLWGMLALALAAGLVACDYGADLYYLLNMNSLSEVSCCSRYGGSGGSKLAPPADYLPWSLPTPARTALFNTLFFAAVPLLALWLLAKSRRREFRRKRFALAESAALLIAAAGLGFASLQEFAEVIAPRLLQASFHHCLYCLMTSSKAPDAPLMIGNVAIGAFAAGWAAVLGAALSRGSPGPSALLLYRRLCTVGATALAAAVLMVVIHLVVPQG